MRQSNGNVLVLSGGGARAYFEWKVVRRLMALGMRWDAVAGVSAGALVGSVTAAVQAGYLDAEYVDALFEGIRQKDVVSGGLSVGRALRLAGIGGRKYSFYDTTPLRRLLQSLFTDGAVFEARDIGVPEVYIGLTLIQQRSYWSARLSTLLPEERIPAILASASMPVMFEPVKSGLPGISWGMDGGVRNNSPLGDILHLQPDHITIVNASNPFARPRTIEDPGSIVDILAETIYHLVNEVFRGDYRQFLDRNAEVLRYVRDTGEEHPKYQWFFHTLIEPKGNPWPKTLDFSPEAKRIMDDEASRLVQQAVAEGSLPFSGG